MKASISNSGHRIRRGQGRQPVVTITIEPESEAERAIMRMAYSGRRRVYIYESGSADVTVVMPRGSNDD